MVEMIKKQTRYSYADIFKAICMFLVILGHAPLCSGKLQKLIYAFHMPAFFLIYGLVYSIESHARRGFVSGKFVISKAKRLILPYFCWAFIYTLFSGSITFRKMLLLIWGSQCALRKADSLTSLWFLPCMFISVILFEQFASYLHNSHSRLLLICVGFITGFGLSTLIPRIDHGYIWSTDVSTMGFCFCLLGFCMQNFVNRSASMSVFQKPLIALISIVVCYWLNRINLQFISINNADMASRNFGNSIIYILSALLGCVSMVLVSMCLSDLKIGGISKVLEKIGKYTLSMLVLHKPMVIFLCSAFTGTMFDNWIGGLAAACIVFGMLAISIEIESSLEKKYRKAYNINLL